MGLINYYIHPLIHMRIKLTKRNKIYLLWKYPSNNIKAVDARQKKVLLIE
jgi:hypothetical protein